MFLYPIIYWKLKKRLDNSSFTESFSSGSILIAFMVITHKFLYKHLAMLLVLESPLRVESRCRAWYQLYCAHGRPQKQQNLGCIFIERYTHEINSDFTLSALAIQFESLVEFLSKYSKEEN